jgi:hypothetical protein
VRKSALLIEILTLLRINLRVWFYPTLPKSPKFRNQILSASGGIASADSVLSPSFPILKILTITICCMLPRLPKYTPVVGFCVKNGFFQKAIFDVNKPYLAINLA